MELGLESSSNSLSPYVRNSASQIFCELERLVSQYGEGVVDGIVPIMIRTLEQVNNMHEDNRFLRSSCAQYEVQIESLTSRLDQEIKARRAGEKQVISLEDEIADVEVQANKKLADLTRLTQILNTKIDAANEHVARLEAKESELQSDLTNAQNRCNELLCSHAAYIERACNRLPLPTTEHFHFCDPQQLIRDEKRSNSWQPSPAKLTPSSVIVQPSQGLLLPSPNKPFLDLPIFGALDETTDYEQYLDDLPSNRLFSEDSEDVISKTSNDCEFLCTDSLEAEVRKLVIDNQELTEMKKALNILKDDLLARIDDLSGENTILRSHLGICREELVAERERAKRRERQLMRRIQNLTSHSPVTDTLCQGQRTKALVRCTSLSESSKPTMRASRLRRTQSCRAILPSMKCMTSSNPQELNSDPKKALSNRPGTVGSDGSSDTLCLAKTAIAKIIRERNFYKERYLDAESSMREQDIVRRTQSSTTPMRKREMATALIAGIFQSVQDFASDVTQGIDELISPIAETPPLSPAYIALWNILGNFVGQAVTYTTDAVIGTGNGLPHDVSKPVIAANVNSEVSLASPRHQDQQRNGSYAN